MIYLFIILITLGLLFFCLSRYTKFKDLQGFGGFSVENTRIIKKIIEKIMPAENTRQYRLKNNYLFVLNSDISIKDFYFAKLIILVLGFTLSIGIVATRIYKSYENCFDVTKYVSCDITRDDYNVLSKDLTFPKGKDKINEDKKILVSNLSNLNSDNKGAIKASNTDKLYDAVKSIHSSLTGVVSFSDILIVFLVLALSWWIPDLVLQKAFMFLADGSFREYDYLLSYLLVSRNEDTESIIRDLTNSSKFYTNFFREYANAYETSSDNAYEFVSSRPEFPVHFQQLVRYIDLLDKEGVDTLEMVVSAKKDQNQEDIELNQRKIIKKRVKFVSRLFTVGFILGIARVMAALVVSYI